jgi:hypothetical protein
VAMGYGISSRDYSANRGGGWKLSLGIEKVTCYFGYLQSNRAKVEQRGRSMGIDNRDNSLRWLASVSNLWVRETRQFLECLEGLQHFSRYPFIVGLWWYQAKKGVWWVDKRDVCEYVVTMIL